MRVFFYVQHLLGTGHLQRVRLLTEAMYTAGLDVHLVSGGGGVPGLPAGVNLVQLPMIKAVDDTFSELVDGQGKPIDAAWKSARCGLLLDHFYRLEPEVLIIESFPFGRRKLKFELVPLLEAARSADPRPRTLCSVRDIVQARRPDRQTETLQMLKSFFDAVMVHGDPAFVSLEESFPRAAEIGDLIHYTGYVARTGEPAAEGRRDQVVVSAGGGAVGAGLLQTAVDAFALSANRHLTWRILAGPNLPERVFHRLQSEAAGNLVVERNRPDFPHLLQRARVSVSQAGYNTVMDVLAARAPAVMVPFEGSGETEQRLRAEKLSDAGVATMISEADLSASTLARAIDRKAADPAPGAPPFTLDGALRSARFVASVCGPGARP